VFIYMWQQLALISPRNLRYYILLASPIIRTAIIYWHPFDSVVFLFHGVHFNDSKLIMEHSKAHGVHFHIIKDPWNAYILFEILHPSCITHHNDYV
jgi:hypothetical protein